MILAKILGLLLVAVFGECSRVNICFKARTADTGTHDGNIVKGQWTQSEILSKGSTPKGAGPLFRQQREFWR